MQFNDIICKEDTNSPIVSPIIVLCEGRQVTSKRTLQGRKWIRFKKKEHCLHLNSCYKVSPYENYGLKLVSQIECLKDICLALVKNVRQNHCTLSYLFCYVTLPTSKTARETYYARYYGDERIEKTYYSPYLTSSSPSNSIMTSSPISWNGAQYFVSEN